MAKIEHGHGGPDIEGVRLPPDTVVEEDDVYNSTSGNWERAGTRHEGIRVPKGNHVIWVRPAPKEA